VGGSSEFDFFSQIPISYILSFLFVGGFYVLLMYFIFKRAAERRRRARMAKGEAQPERQISMPVGQRLAQLSQTTTGFAQGFQKTVQQTLQQGRPAASGPALPEPDLDLLTTLPDFDLNTLPMPEAPTNPPAVIEAQVVSQNTITPPVLASQEIRLNMAQPDSDKMPADLSDAVEVLRVLRDMSDGRIIIQIGNQYYRSPAEIKAPELLRRFNAIVAELAAMVGLGGGNRPNITPLPPAGSSGPVSNTPIGLKNKVGTITPLAPASQPEPATKGKRGKASEPTGPSFAEAVENFLQYRLLANPQWATRSIHIRPSHDQGIRIEVDGYHYEGIAEVVDPDVRDFLTVVMKEWENRS
jgi:hypothetical protein